MEGHFHGSGTALPTPEPPFRVRIDSVPRSAFPPLDSPVLDGIPLHRPGETWYERCQQFPPNGETNMNNPERETA